VIKRDVESQDSLLCRKSLVYLRFYPPVPPSPGGEWGRAIFLALVSSFDGVIGCGSCGSTPEALV
jgi:hypothetical protein